MPDSVTAEYVAGSWQNREAALRDAKAAAIDAAHDLAWKLKAAGCSDADRRRLVDAMHDAINDCCADAETEIENLRYGRI